MPAEIWSSRLRAESEAGGGGRGRHADLIKSRDPHLAGGELVQTLLWIKPLFKKKDSMYFICWVGNQNMHVRTVKPCLRTEHPDTTNISQCSVDQTSWPSERQCTGNFLGRIVAELCHGRIVPWLCNGEVQRQIVANQVNKSRSNN